MAVAHRLASIKGVAIIGAPAHSAHVMHLFKEEIETIGQAGRATVSIGGRPFEVSASFIGFNNPHDNRSYRLFIS